MALTRHIYQEILVVDRDTGEQIVITPTGNQIKMEIEASDRFEIPRRELLEQADQRHRARANLRT